MGHKAEAKQAVKRILDDLEAQASKDTAEYVEQLERMLSDVAIGLVDAQAVRDFVSKNWRTRRYVRAVSKSL